MAYIHTGSVMVTNATVVLTHARNHTLFVKRGMNINVDGPRRCNGTYE